MAKILDFLGRKHAAALSTDATLASMLDSFSIEVMPRTAAKIEDFRAILPRGTRVYIAHIEGTSIEDMVATARRLTDDNGLDPSHSRRLPAAPAGGRRGQHVDP